MHIIASKTWRYFPIKVHIEVAYLENLIRKGTPLKLKTKFPLFFFSPTETQVRSETISISFLSKITFRRTLLLWTCWRNPFLRKTGQTGHFSDKKRNWTNGIYSFCSKTNPRRRIPISYFLKMLSETTCAWYILCNEPFC